MDKENKWHYRLDIDYIRHRILPFWLAVIDAAPMITLIVVALIVIYFFTS